MGMRQTRKSRCGKSEADKQRASCTRCATPHRARQMRWVAWALLNCVCLTVSRSAASLAALRAPLSIARGHAALQSVFVSASLAAVLPAFALCVPLARCLPLEQEHTMLHAPHARARNEMCARGSSCNTIVRANCSAVRLFSWVGLMAARVDGCAG